MTVVAAPVLARLSPGEPLPFDVGLLDLGGFVALVTPPGTPWLPNAITLDPGPLVVWDPVLPALEPGPRLAARGGAVLAALTPFAAAGPLNPRVEALVGWEWAALLGRGRGLTPEGDDLLAGALAVAAATCAPAALPSDLRERTTALSATLLELAAAGAAPRPLHGVLDLGGENWRGALRELERLGASSGRAIARGAAIAAAAIGDGGCVRPLAARHLQA
jgi:hypothetical protein